MPVCSKCGEDKPVTEFYLRSDNRLPRKECKKCNNDSARAWKERNEDRHRTAVDERYRTYGRFARYGITKEVYEAAFERQGQKCALCDSPDPGGKGEWHIDHAHEPGAMKTGKTGFYQTRDGTKFRGLLCHECNVGLGQYETLSDRVGEERIVTYRDSRFDQSGLPQIKWTEKQLRIMGNDSQKELDL